MVHTHAPQQRSKWDDDENEMTMKMEWKVPNQDTKEERKRRGKEQTPTRHT